VRDEVRRQVCGLGGVGSVGPRVVEEDQRSPVRYGTASDRTFLGRHSNRARQQARDRVRDCYHPHHGLDHQDDRYCDEDYGNPGVRQAAWDIGSQSWRQQGIRPSRRTAQFRT
jgi:hypothetical protein